MQEKKYLATFFKNYGAFVEFYFYSKDGSVDDFKRSYRLSHGISSLKSIDLESLHIEEYEDIDE